ncbi:MAG: adaptor protein MecA [Lachnospiraceae bacterium]|nr:adaptor protein MecA [Lachnospiraceae bacterium]
MKIERISENQIKCTLTKEDLYARQLKISELAYGSEKVKELFVEVCRKAFVECDFEADDMPLMIEAIPVSPDCLILLMTKVEDPEELDVRFSNFTSVSDESDPILSNEERVYADEVIGCMERLNKLLGNPLASKLFTPGTEGSGAPEVSLKNISRVYSFDSLDSVIRLAKVIYKYYHGENTLYKDDEAGNYYLVVNMSEHTPEQFNKICNIISEYVTVDKYGTYDIDFFKEHYSVIVKDKAVQVLRKM